MTPLIRRQSLKVADNIEDDLRGVSANELFIGVIGLITGLLIALLITQIYVSITNRYVYTVITIITYMVLGYLGVVIATKKGKEMVGMLVSSKGQTAKDPLFSKAKKKNAGNLRNLRYQRDYRWTDRGNYEDRIPRRTYRYSRVCAGRTAPYCGFFGFAEADKGQTRTWTS